MIRYECKIETHDSVKYIKLGVVGEIAQLYVNDTYCGTCISHPYVFDVSKAWKKGENSLSLKLQPTPVT